MLITFPFFVDVMGNVLNLYDSIDWWDDVNHFANWLFLSLGLGVLLLRTAFPPIALAGFVLAFGASVAILWELGEYVTFIRTNEDEFDTAYTDTLGDLTFDLVGATIAVRDLLPRATSPLGQGRRGVQLTVTRARSRVRCSGSCPLRPSDAVGDYRRSMSSIR